jgi:hypothetical protein
MSQADFPESAMISVVTDTGVPATVNLSNPNILSNTVLLFTSNRVNDIVGVFSTNLAISPTQQLPALIISSFSKECDILNSLICQTVANVYVSNSLFTVDWLVAVNSVIESELES